MEAKKNFEILTQIFSLLRDKISRPGCQRSSSGVHCIEKLHKTKSECLMATFNFSFMHDPQIPNFHLANLELNTIFDHFDAPVGPCG